MRGPVAPSARRFEVEGHVGWAHDEGHPAGTFHTYDALPVGSGPRKVHVFLPRSSSGPWPVVYMLDGDTTFWRGGAFGKTWDVAGRLGQLQGEVRDVIVVAVHPLDRNAEYTHVDWSHGRRAWGGLPGFTHALADGLKPFVDRTYQTRADPAHTAIVGSSHGGLAAFWIATRRPETFGNAGCMSPSFFSGLDSLTWGARPTPLAESALVRGARFDPPPRFWLCWGLRRDGGDHNAVVEHLATRRGREMAQWLRHQGVAEEDLFVCEDPAGGHDEESWHRRFGWMMRALFPRNVDR